MKIEEPYNCRMEPTPYSRGSSTRWRGRFAPQHVSPLFIVETKRGGG